MNYKEEFMEKNSKEIEKHPCGDCIYFGDKCMENLLNCEYSDKSLINNK